MEVSDFDSVVSFSQSLSQWSVLIIGGLTALLFGDSHLSSSNKRIRCLYLLFVPAWSLLFWSIFMGVKAQRNYLALKVLAHVDTAGARGDMNDNVACQLLLMQHGLCVIGVWLFGYLIWWVASDEASAARKARNEKAH